MPHAQQLGRYQLLDRIAFGGMAEIFRAKTFDDEGRVHLVAVKRVLSHLIEDDEFLQMIVDEAKISALLRHENIAQLYEFAHAGNEYFLAMEYVDGKDLRAVMERVRATGRMLPFEHVAWVAMETAQALHAAHTQRDARGQFLRIVHRDVSPSNVLCSYRGEVKLCDFGIAKATLTRIQTKTGVIKGKVKYMSPEQAMGRKLDHRSDLFSLGTVMYEMLALAPPFMAQTEVELIFTVREAKKRAVTDYRPDTPAELAAIVDKAMSRSRSGRYQSGEELARDLKEWIDEYKPGYRRGHFAQYMRQIFHDAIEQELRQLEEYVLDGADVGQVGENLIADALAPDAPFTKFTPFARGGTSTDISSLIPMEAIEDLAEGPADVPGELHEKPTMMIERARLGLGPSLHEMETQHKAQHADRVAAAAVPLPERGTLITSGPADGGRAPARRIIDPARIHDEPTRLHALREVDAAQVAAAVAALTGGRSIHDEDTGKKQLLDAHELAARDPFDEEPAGEERSSTGEEVLEELEPEVIGHGFHDEQTRLLGLDAASLARLRDPSQPAPRASEGTGLRRMPRPDDAQEDETSSQRPALVSPERHNGEHVETTAIPLRESDLHAQESLPDDDPFSDLLHDLHAPPPKASEPSEVTTVPLSETDLVEGE